MRHQPLDVGHQLLRVTGLVEVAGDAVGDDVDRPAGPRRDHGHPAGQRLLGRLAVGLVAPGVHEDVERGVGARELLAVEDAEEGRVRQQRPEPGLLGPAADEHETHARDPVDVGQQLQLLLRGQPADVPDEEPAVGGELGVEGLVAALPVRTAPGPRRAASGRPRARRARRAGRCSRWRAPACGRPPGGSGGSAPPSPARRRGRRTLGEADQVGLVDRDRRDAERPRRPRRLAGRARRVRRCGRRRGGSAPWRRAAGAGSPARCGSRRRTAGSRRGRGSPGSRRTSRGRSARPARPRAPRPRGAPAPGARSW